MEQERKELLKEYEEKVKRFHILWLLKILGFLPFYIQNGKIISKNITPKLCLISFLVIWHLCALYAYINSREAHSFFIRTENVIVLVTIALQDSMLLNNLLTHLSYGEILCKNLIDIDIILGVAETKFIRDIPARQYVIVSIICGAIQTTLVLISCIMWTTDWSVKFAVAVFFGFNLIFHNFCFSVSIVLFLTMRVRYLSVALIKLAKLNPTYFPKYLLFDRLFWKNKFDDLIKFHLRADCRDFTETYKIIHLQLRLLEKYCRLFIFTSILGVLLITFSALQALIDYLVTLNSIQNVFGAIWAIGSGLFTVGSFIQVDFLYDEIERTKLICTYILLKDSIPFEIIQIAESILKTLSTRKYIATVYDMFELNSGMILSLAAALIVYITMQLQIALKGM